MEIDTYLQRIGLNHAKEANLETLSELQMQHMLHVPFENLDVMGQIPIPLDVESFYNKIVLDRRGGFCYEMNGLFHWLLTSLGFDSHFVSGTIQRADGTWAREGSHATIIVDLDQPYLVDVGFGDAVRVPLPLTGESRDDVSGTYRAVKVQENIFSLQRSTDDQGRDWKTLYRFETTPRALTDFEEASHFNQSSPKSHFTQKEIVSLATPEGRVSLSGNSFIVTYRGEKKTSDIRDVDKPSVLEQYFGINLPLHV